MVYVTHVFCHLSAFTTFAWLTVVTGIIGDQKPNQYVINLITGPWAYFQLNSWMYHTIRSPNVVAVSFRWTLHCVTSPRLLQMQLWKLLCVTFSAHNIHLWCGILKHRTRYPFRHLTWFTSPMCSATCQHSPHLLDWQVLLASLVFKNQIHML